MPSTPGLPPSPREPCKARNRVLQRRSRKKEAVAYPRTWRTAFARGTLFAVWTRSAQHTEGTGFTGLPRVTGFSAFAGITRDTRSARLALQQTNCVSWLAKLLLKQNYHIFSLPEDPEHQGIQRVHVDLADRWDREVRADPSDHHLP